jgi:ATP-dependent helicase/nuclease subunit A
MSIHQSKGLEFPVVVLADLGKQFNFSDLKAEIILDEKYGLCPRVKPPHTGRRYPSLPYWLARRRHKLETLGEELRLLYVAMTRARDTLILTGNLSARKFESQWREHSGATLASQLSARSYLDWLAIWTADAPETLLSDADGENQWFDWFIYDAGDQRLVDTPATSGETAQTEDDAPLKPKFWRDLRQRLAWKYPHGAATREPAKTSVTAARRRIADAADDAIAPAPKFQAGPHLFGPRGKLSATETGLAHHTFLQFVALDKLGSVAELKEEAARLERENHLTEEEAASLDLTAIAAFWQSDLGKKIRAHSDEVLRELEFTARFSPGELSGAAPGAPKWPAEDFVLVQGAADLAILLPEEIWIVDFKTDRFSEEQLDVKVKFYEPQLRLYAAALGRIYQRPVSQLHLHFFGLRRTVPVKKI